MQLASKTGRKSLYIALMSNQLSFASMDSALF